MFKNILIADDHFVVRSGTAMALHAYDNTIQISFAESFYEAADLMEAGEFELIFLDINMPGVEKSVVKEIKRKFKNIKIIIFSAHTGGIVNQFIREGADGYLHKHSNSQQIVEAVKAIYKDGYFLPTELMVDVINMPEMVNPEKFLSDREFEIFELFAQGLGNLEITNALDIQPGTVSTYKKRIFKKLHVQSIAELVKIHLNFKK
ncbi:response regulator transcription factor [Epilithonimonas sp. JDS]|uniref:response regulator transcription factor n=1 Tax=Epilithonimonas sp. JDS TaxID=2902797 RepID=UPI001E34AB18|nr:response regulator transcription factor [Epilithonimonas sp. JDS]MCD9856818.1 response regulator transcription factor [Epilithonimonas sp. JDS]